MVILRFLGDIKVNMSSRQLGIKNKIPLLISEFRQKDWAEKSNFYSHRCRDGTQGHGLSEVTSAVNRDREKKGRTEP